MPLQLVDHTHRVSKYADRHTGCHTGLQHMCPTSSVFLFCSRACSTCCRSHSLCVCACVFLRLVPGPPAASCGCERGPSAATPCGWVEKLTSAFFARHLQSLSDTMSVFETPSVWLLSLEGHPLQVTYHADRVTGQSRLQKVTTSWTHWPRLNPYTQHHSSHGQHN